MVSVVPLNANAVAAIHVEAKANPKRARMLVFAEIEVGVNEGTTLLRGLERELIPFAAPELQ